MILYLVEAFPRTKCWAFAISALGYACYLSTGIRYTAEPLCMAKSSAVCTCDVCVFSFYHRFFFPAELVGRTVVSVSELFSQYKRRHVP